MKNKLVKLVLSCLLVVGVSNTSAQISAMNPANNLDDDSLHMIAKYLDSVQDIVNFRKVGHKFNEIIDGFHYSAVGVNSEIEYNVFNGPEIFHVTNQGIPIYTKIEDFRQGLVNNLNFHPNTAQQIRSVVYWRVPLDVAVGAIANKPNDAVVHYENNTTIVICQNANTPHETKIILKIAFPGA